MNKKMNYDQNASTNKKKKFCLFICNPFLGVLGFLNQNFKKPDHCTVSKRYYTFGNLYLRQTVTELQEFGDVFIGNTHVGVPLGTVKG